MARRRTPRGGASRVGISRNERASWHGTDGPASKKALERIDCPDCQANELAGDRVRRFPVTVASLDKEHKRTCKTCDGKGWIQEEGRHDPMLEPPARAEA